jgi:hypothetical protein
LLKRVQARELAAGRALKIISQTKRQVEGVRERLRQLGQNDEQLALVKRYAAAMSTPMDLSEPETDSQRRGELLLAVDQLMRRLQRDFLK